ncbi:MAG: hypothetical protein SGBAC_013160 [Bacillariaceae sp.]
MKSSEEETEQPSIFVYRDVDGRPSTTPRDVTHVLVPEESSTIHQGAFKNFRSLVEVQMTLGLQAIGAHAFDNCTCLTTISLPVTVETLDDSSFAWCRSLTDVHLNKGLRHIGNSVFEGTSLTSITVPSTVETIGARAFYGCFLMTTLSLEDGLLEIGVRAFASCAKLTEVTIPSTIETLNSGAFAWCKSLSTIHLPFGLKHISDNLLERCLALEHVALPSTVETIGNRAFEYCTCLSTIELPEQLKSIGFLSFAECCLLKNLCFPSSLVSIGKAAFIRCRILTDSQLPYGLKSLGEYAFADCDSLRHVSVPSTVKCIESGTFQGCCSMTEVVLKEGLESIGDSAFAFCESLTAIAFPRSLNMVGRAFNCCLNLRGVEIPNDSWLIMTYRPPCFSRCSSLVTVQLPSAMDESAVHAFSDCELLQNCEANGGHAKLRNRFQDLPVHNVCYHASHTTLEDLSQALDAVTDNCRLVDDYGMTPCHIVATTSNLRWDMFVLLLDRYPTKIMWLHDCHERTMMFYLTRHHSDKVIPLIKTALLRAIGFWTNDWGLEEYRLDLTHRVESLSWADDIKLRQEQLGEILQRLGYYREMEATSTIELAMWKMAMNQTHSGDQLSPLDRASYRLRCGADVVLLNVMECLWNGTHEAVYWI